MKTGSAEPRTMTCLTCPRGCRLSVSKRRGEVIVSGHHCPKGPEYARSELTAPMRILTTTVRTTLPAHPRLPVKTDCEVPLGDIRSFMIAISSIVVGGDVRCGDVIAENLLDHGVDLVATDSIEIDPVKLVISEEAR